MAETRKCNYCRGNGKNKTKQHNKATHIVDAYKNPNYALVCQSCLTQYGDELGLVRPIGQPASEGVKPSELNKGG